MYFPGAQIAMEREPIDLQKRRLARELEAELGGLFGIGLPDIEQAIERLYLDFASGSYNERERQQRLPEPLQRVIHSLDVIYEIARLEQAEETRSVESGATLEHIIALVENYLDRIKRLGDDPGA
jgi:hypothetical protein